MRNLLAFIAAVAITIALVGWYLDWFQIRTGTSTEPGHRNVEIDVNTKKIGQDLRNGEEKIQKAIEKNKDDVPTKIEGAKEDVRSGVQSSFSNVRD